ncbi:hypothetical protein SeMB42_g00661 [Synchytrium endobioticum]|uniref:Small ribosomal subunit protein mS29 n=1 Tax=Synchytrium endobioticum TaxID=286115 RepID=A0A507DPY1_9FUNG|nr:hypothetical protein SeMB42_g00661 [Synchytrium endobioticum]
MIKRQAYQTVRSSPTVVACRRYMKTTADAGRAPPVPPFHTRKELPSPSPLPQPAPSTSPNRHDLPTWGPGYVTQMKSQKLTYGSPTLAAPKVPTGVDPGSPFALLPDDVMSAFHTHLPKPLAHHFFLVRQPALLVREPVLRLLTQLRKQTPVLLDGAARVGKSSTLLQAVSHHYSLGALVVYIPHASSWIAGTAPFIHNPTTGLYDQPRLAADIIRQILHVNHKRLENYIRRLSTVHVYFPEIIVEKKTEDYSAHTLIDVSDLCRNKAVLPSPSLGIADVDIRLQPLDGKNPAPLQLVLSFRTTMFKPALLAWTLAILARGYASPGGSPVCTLPQPGNHQEEYSDALTHSQEMNTKSLGLKAWVPIGTMDRTLSVTVIVMRAGYDGGAGPQGRQTSIPKCWSKLEVELTNVEHIK